MRSFIDRLCSFAGRGPCTDAERRAAGWLHDELRVRGQEAWVETHWVRPQWASSLILAAALGVAASVIAPTVPVAGVVGAAVAAISLGVDSLGRPGPLRWLLYRRATQNVLVPPEDPERIALWLVARYDAPRRGLFARHLPRARPWLAGCALVIAAAAAARVAGADGLAVGLVQFVPTVGLLVALAAAADAALSGVSPGANDNASGVAVAVEVLEELRRRPPARLAPALLLHGAGEGDPLALRAQVRADGLSPADNVLLELRPAGAGEVAWSTRHPQLRAACEAAGGRRLRAVSGAGGLPYAAVGCVDARGRVPRSRAADDLPEQLDDAALENAVDYVLLVVETLDAELAAHDATVPGPA